MAARGGGAASACRKGARAFPPATCAAINAADGPARMAPPGAACGSGAVHVRPTPAPTAACAGRVKDFRGDRRRAGRQGYMPRGD